MTFTIENKQKLTLEQFLSLPESDATLELVDGEAIPKMSPKFFHSVLTTTVWLELSAWSASRGRVMIEWAVLLVRQNQDWCPVPDVLYVSHDRLSADWKDNTPCPVPPELIIEIMSEGQTFKYFIAKAGDYLNAGVERVWVIDPDTRSLTVFYPNLPPETYRNDRVICDNIFPSLEISLEQLFIKAGI